MQQTNLILNSSLSLKSISLGIRKPDKLFRMWTAFFPSSLRTQMQFLPSAVHREYTPAQAQGFTPCFLPHQVRAWKTHILLGQMPDGDEVVDNELYFHGITKSITTSNYCIWLESPFLDTWGVESGNPPCHTARYQLHRKASSGIRNWVPTTLNEVKKVRRSWASSKAPELKILNETCSSFNTS